MVHDVPGSGPGRPERADPDRVTDRASFVTELQLLKDRSGLSFRDIMRGTGAGDGHPLPFTSIRDYVSGTSLPPAERLVRIVRACGEAETAARWEAALRRVRDSERDARAARPDEERARHLSVRPVTPCPYRGLASYRTEDAAFFHGRERLLAELLRRLAPAAEHGGMLTVVGPSGAGKSSLLHAGLVPALHRGDLPPPGAGRWYVGALDAGPDTLADLDAHRAAAGGAPTVLVVDRVEQLFTDAVPAATRSAILDRLAETARPAPGDGPPVVVVLGLRADFYARALSDRHLLHALSAAQVTVGPMTEDELREVVVAPARDVGVQVEDGLTELLLAELRAGVPAGSGTRAADTHAAATLPLLSHALATTWERGGARMTVAAYREGGGLREAVASSAEQVWTALPAAERAVARRVFLRLVRSTPDLADTRRRAAREELLGPPGEEDAAVAGVVARFAEARLLTLDAEAVEIAHEVLLRAWPRLAGWLDDDRAARAARGRLTEGARLWQDTGRDDGALLRGRVLDDVQDAAAGEDLLPREAEFLRASLARRDRERAVELRRARRLRRGLAVLVVVSVVAVSALGVAVAEWVAASRARDTATSRELAVEADTLRATDPNLAMQFAVAAYATSPTDAARSSVLESSTTSTATRLLSPAGTARQAAWTADGRTMLTVDAAEGSADAALQRWDVTGTGTPVAAGGPVGTGQPGADYALAVSPDGRLAATAGTAGTVRLWDVAADGAPRPLGPAAAAPGGTVYGLAFSPDGAVLAAATADGSVLLWSLADPARPVAAGPSLATGGGPVRAIAFAPTGRLLATGQTDGGVRLWDVADPAAPTPVGAPLPAGRTVFALAFTRDGTRLAAAGLSRTVSLWDVADPADPTPVGSPLAGPTAQVNSLAVSPDGSTIAAASSDDRVWTWDLRTGAPAGTRPHPSTVTQVGYDGGRLVTVGGDGTIRFWDAGDARLTDPHDTVFALDWSADGRSVALGVGGTAKNVRIWDVTDPRAPAALTPALTAAAGAPGLSGSVARSPDGRVVASGATDGGVVLWDVGPDGAVPRPQPLPGDGALVEQLEWSPDGRTLAVAGDDDAVRLFDMTRPTSPLAATLTGPHSYVFGAAWSPDSHLLAAVSADTTVRIWDVADPARPRQLGDAVAAGSGYAYSVAFSPDGRTLATGTADKTVRLWDVADPADPTPVGEPLTGPGNTVFGLAYSPDGRLVAAGSGDGTVRIWDVTDPASPTTWATLHGGFTAAVWAVGFSPDGSRLAAAGADGVVRLWDVDVARDLAAVCAATGDPVTRAEWTRFLPDTPYRPPC
ncbi:WD40 repeat-containing protein [Pseudonocardia dioxanivorans CB1190]|uniref:WD40 repeat-containing protein n=1 Tax=Pseudonocardia dioxanivorans (strain ATCC 55486 / DSM 44775 / JCM 13855 / CB1190) TaxID=675635 RepID=F4CVC5_PSEUX|nr:WD40 repeat domain-containing protein [Pseudonocardia dioxanivorans]AEA23189.1 WD40 repeat-containing protein [Pseudonocardia dioxanivorans CB1190]